MVSVCTGKLSTTKTKIQIYVGCLDHDGMVIITLEKLQRGAQLLVGLLVLSPFLWMQSSKAILRMYLRHQIYVGFVAPFISYNRGKFKRDE